ncbi:OLC1v1014419C1 [Oldenlandia corymbosa var. corymbosa]|uniref:OLC1v1014419C1 n=1 Tax=Oldenlandia corymbosa var. corymbosa TaxID=529605 RepID=A0AAV1E0M7_OLDCO|nr:OLC1v1014419C1 [Oldenlandia corymbosa var. corymbosa]
MAAKLLATILVTGTGVVARSLAQAYRQALANAAKNGVAQETVQSVVKSANKTMNAAEARQILGVSEKASWQDILQKYDTLFEKNAKQGSFYLQSKVHRAKECLETILGPQTGA